MKERELAENMVFIAEHSFNNIGLDYKGAIIDYEEFFGKGCYNLRLFVDECYKIGYDVFPLEDTPYALMPLEGKLVVEKRRQAT